MPEPRGATTVNLHHHLILSLTEQAPARNSQHAVRSPGHVVRTHQLADAGRIDSRDAGQVQNDVPLGMAQKEQHAVTQFAIDRHSRSLDFDD